MRKYLVAMATCIFLFLGAEAQDFMSNRDLLTVKEESETQRMVWNKTFDEAVQNNDFSKLRPMRENYEAFLKNYSARFRRLMVEGDGRALLTAVSNYFQIQQGFVRDAMVPAESLTAASTEEIARINQRIVDFVQKEKVFVIEVSNAIATSPEPIPPVDPEMNNDDEEEAEPAATDVSARSKKVKSKRASDGRDTNRRKLPHEIEDEKNKDKDSESEDE